jgi:hypothetical protein
MENVFHARRNVSLAAVEFALLASITSIQARQELAALKTVSFLVLHARIISQPYARLAFADRFWMVKHAFKILTVILTHHVPIVGKAITIF